MSIVPGREQWTQLQRSLKHITILKHDYLLFDAFCYVKIRSDAVITIDLFCTCLGFYVLFENSPITWRRHHYRWRAANFNLCSSLMAIEQWGLLSVQNVLYMWLWTSVYIGYLRGLTQQVGTTKLPVINGHILISKYIRLLQGVTNAFDDFVFFFIFVSLDCLSLIWYF